MVDVIGGLGPEPHLKQVSDHLHHVLAPERPGAQRSVDLELLVDHKPSDPRQVVAAGVKEHPAEERACGLDRRRVTGAQAAVNLHQRLIGILKVIPGEGVIDGGVRLGRVHHQEFEGGGLPGHDVGQRCGGDLVVGLQEHLAGLLIDDAARGPLADQLLGAH